MEAPAQSIAPAEHWDLRDVIANVQQGEKGVSSLDGHQLAPSSPHFSKRQSMLKERRQAMEVAILSRDFPRLAELLEEEAVELHLIAMSSRPAVFYWNSGTLEVLHTIRALRRDGVQAACTMDAGANVHVICEAEAESQVVAALRSLPAVKEIFLDRIGHGPRVEESQ
jgi:diphosphomevalonate decarboxylase